MGKYERLSRKIDKNEEAMDALNALDSNTVQNIRFHSVDAAAMYNTRKIKKLERKNERLQTKKDKIDTKLDEETTAVNESLKELFGDDMKLPDKDSPNFEQEAQELIDAMKQKILDNPGQYKDFVNNMSRCPTKWEIAVNSLHPVAIAKVLHFRKEYPDIANLVDAGFRIRGRALDRKKFDATTWTITDSVDVNNVEITFDPSGKVWRNIDNHQENDIQMVKTWEIDYDAAKQAYHDARDEQIQAKKFARQQKRNNTEGDTDV